MKSPILPTYTIDQAAIACITRSRSQLFLGAMVLIALSAGVVFLVLKNMILGVALLALSLLLVVAAWLRQKKSAQCPHCAERMRYSELDADRESLMQIIEGVESLPVAFSLPVRTHTVEEGWKVGAFLCRECRSMAVYSVTNPKLPTGDG